MRGDRRGLMKARGAVAQQRTTDHGQRCTISTILPPHSSRSGPRPGGSRLIFTTGDLMCLVGLCAVLFAASVVGWYTEPELAIATAAAGRW